MTTMPANYTHVNKPLNVFKLTDQNHTTMNNTQWAPNKTHETDGDTPYLANNSWLHFYTSPITAVLLNPVHGKFQNPILWQAKAEGTILLDKDIKGGCTKLTTIQIIPTPNISDQQRVEFAARLTLQTITQIQQPYSGSTKKLVALLQRLAELKPTTQKEFNDPAHQEALYRYHEVVGPLAEFTNTYYSNQQNFLESLRQACANTSLRAFRRLKNNSLNSLTHNFFQTQTDNNQ